MASGTCLSTDPDNSRIVKISNPLTSAVFPGVWRSGRDTASLRQSRLTASANLFVADGSTLSEIVATFDGPPVAITNGLAAPVTGLAVDPSGSVVVAQSGGILRIPSNAGVLTANSAVAIDSGVVTSPNGLAIDTTGNLYVSDLTGRQAEPA